MTERKQTIKVLSALANHGFRVTRVNDGGDEDVVIVPASAEQMVADATTAVFSVDCSHVYVRKDGHKEHWIFFVLGNAPDGSEVVSDYGYSEPDADGFRAIMDELTS